MAKVIPAEPTWLRTVAIGRHVGVDRANNIIRGMVVAQEGLFKTPGRGRFNEQSLAQIVGLMRLEPMGLKSRLTHPTLSSDGLGKFLGRAKDPSIDAAQIRRDGQQQTVRAVRADLHIDQTALEEPVGGGKPLGLYVMDLAESDPDALSSSLVLKADQEQELDAAGRKPLADAEGNPLPPLWRPTELHAADIVDTGEAVDGLLSAQLSADGLPDELVRRGVQLLDGFLPDAPREVVHARLQAWLHRYLVLRYGDSPATPSTARRELRSLLRKLETAGQ